MVFALNLSNARGIRVKKLLSDIDLNPPNLPTWNTKDFNGDNKWKLNYLERMQPVGWLEEGRKGRFLKNKKQNETGQKLVLPF